jgi:hypothetical protein
LKVKHRETVDVVCGAVIGTRTAPQEVLAGLAIDGELRIVGRTTLQDGVVEGHPSESAPFTPSLP